MATVPKGPDHITIATGLDTLTMSSSSRVALVDELQRYETGYTIRDAFTAVGASSPVKLRNEQKAELLRVIEVWGQRTEGGMRDSRRQSSRCATPSKKTCATWRTGATRASRKRRPSVTAAGRRALRLTRLRHIGTPAT